MSWPPSRADPFRLTPRPQRSGGAAGGGGAGSPAAPAGLAHGDGKTIIFALLVQRRGGRALILAHRDELIQQAVDKLHLVDPTPPLGVVQAETGTTSIVIASVQTLSRRTRLTTPRVGFPDHRH